MIVLVCEDTLLIQKSDFMLLLNQEEDVEMEV